MKRLILRRLLFMVFVIWGVTLITFFLARVAPGDPARLIAGPHANAAALQNIREIYGLDRPSRFSTSATSPISSTGISARHSSRAAPC